MSDLASKLQETLTSAYRVERELPGGGMSRVFVAHDVELDRKIVVKVLPPDLAAGLSVERFRREIQLAAKLQHPHIVPLISAGAKDGLLYYTMPFIEGESLRARLVKQRELPVHEAVRILRDVADALAYAHSHNVVHRDIKPDNIIVSGHHALVLDFGVSKAVSISTGESKLTSIGVALGTPAYMSPEQATADASIDHRCDIYALGVVAYELLTGRHPFVASTAQQLLAAHITEVPTPVRTHRNALSPELAGVVDKCLEKKPADRWQTAEELLTQLEVAATPSGGTQPYMRAAKAPGSQAFASRRAWFVAGAAVAIVAIVGLALRNRSVPTYETVSTTQITNTPGLELHPAISPDGRFVAYAAGTIGHMRIFVRQTSGGRAVNLTDAMAGDHRIPRWSADGNQIEFMSNDGLYVVPQLGGTPKRVWAVPGLPKTGVSTIASISPDGKSLAFVDQGSVFVQPIGGGTAIKIGASRDPSYIVWNNDGSRLAWVSDNPDFLYAQLSMGNVAPAAIWIGFPDGRPAVRATNETALNTSPTWTPEGNLLYVSNEGGGRDIYEQALSASGEPRGAPVRVTTGLNVHSITMSPDGARVVYSTFNRRSNVWTVPIGSPISAAWAITSENQLVEGAAVSHDGKWLVYDSNRGGRQQLYKIPVGGGEPEQLTRDSTDHFAGRWSSDDRHIVFHAWNKGTRDVFEIDPDGSNQHAIISLPGHEFYPELSPSQKQIVLRYRDVADARSRVAIVSQDASGAWSAPRTLDDSANTAHWSPDGNWLLEWNTPGALMVTHPDGGERRVLVPSNAEFAPMFGAWSRDGRVAYYNGVNGEGEMRIFAVPTTGGTPRLILRFPDPAKRLRRPEFDVDAKALYFTIAEDESDIYMLELRRKR